MSRFFNFRGTVEQIKACDDVEAVGVAKRNI
jgi:hypothetical protein